LKSYSKALEKKGEFTKIIKDLVLILRPSAEIRVTADELKVPTCLNAMGWKMYKSWADWHTFHIFLRRPIQQLQRENSQRHTTQTRDRWRYSPRRAAYPLAKAEELNHAVFCCRILRGRSAPLYWHICSDESPGDDVIKGLVWCGVWWFFLTHIYTPNYGHNMHQPEHRMDMCEAHRDSCPIWERLQCELPHHLQRRSPQAVIGNARSEYSLWWADAARNCPL